MERVGQPGWDRAAIEAAAAGERTVRVRVARPVSVYVLYATAEADDPVVVRFHPDIYGHDRTLERALRLPPTTRGAVTER